MVGSNAGFVAFTSGECSSDCHILGVHYSPDGRSWQPAEYPADTFTDASIRTVIPYQSGFLAVGSTMHLYDDPHVAAAAWLSPDGRSWQKADLGTSADVGVWMTVCEGDGLFAGGMEQVASAGNRLFALGSEIHIERKCRATPSAASWVSDDGLTWKRTNTPPRDPWSEAGIAGGTEFVLLTTAATQRQQLWFSPSGADWTQASVEGADRAFVHRVERLRDSYVGLGWDSSSDAAPPLAWTSTDGSRWRLATPDGFGQGTQPFLNVSASDSVIVASGIYGTYLTPDGVDWQKAGLTTSRDGTHWSAPETAPFVGYFISSFANNDTSIVVAVQPIETAGLQVWVRAVP
jgi:hypothetical protein